jgi:hypothetical protein
LLKAVTMMKTDRLERGLPLERWLTHVRADVMKFSTPLEIRKRIGGAANASTRVTRTTTVSECLRVIYNDKRDVKLIDKILLAVEECGLNVDANTPVCAISKYATRCVLRM